MACSFLIVASRTRWSVNCLRDRPSHTRARAHGGSAGRGGHAQRFPALPLCAVHPGGQACRLISRRFSKGTWSSCHRPYRRLLLQRHPRCGCAGERPRTLVSIRRGCALLSVKLLHGAPSPPPSPRLPPSPSSYPHPLPPLLVAGLSPFIRPDKPSPTGGGPASR